MQKRKGGESRHFAFFHAVNDATYFLHPALESRKYSLARDAHLRARTCTSASALESHWPTLVHARYYAFLPHLYCVQSLYN